MKKLTSIFLMVMLLLAGCSAKPTGNIVARHSDKEDGIFYGVPGDTMRNEFFDFIVEKTEVMDSFGGYTAAEDMRLLCVTVKETNTFGEALPMYATDFVLTWDASDEFYYPLSDLNDSQVMPEEFELAKGESGTYKIVFEIPKDTMEFELIYLEEYDNDETGDFFVVTIAV